MFQLSSVGQLQPKVDAMVRAPREAVPCSTFFELLECQDFLADKSPRHVELSVICLSIYCLHPSDFGSIKSTTHGACEGLYRTVMMLALTNRVSFPGCNPVAS